MVLARLLIRPTRLFCGIQIPEELDCKLLAIRSSLNICHIHGALYNRTSILPQLNMVRNTDWH